MIFGFSVLSNHDQARVGKLTTLHGIIDTPAFVPVGTQATVKSLPPPDLKSLGSQAVLANTYHLYLQPGADLIFALDECTSPLHDREYTEISLRRPHAWEERSLIVHRKSQQISAKIGKHRILDKSEKSGSDLSDLIRNPISADSSRFEPAFSGNQAMYGIIQGGPYEDLRKESAKFVASHDFFGTAVGGALVNKSKMLQILDWIMPILPPDRPNHLLGSSHEPVNGRDQARDIR